MGNPSNSNDRNIRRVPGSYRMTITGSGKQCWSGERSVVVTGIKRYRGGMRVAIKILTLDGLYDSKLVDLLGSLLKTIPEVSNAHYDSLSQKLTLDISEQNSAQTVNEVAELIRMTFPDVTVKRIDVGADTPPQDKSKSGPYIIPEDERLPIFEEEMTEKKRDVSMSGADIHVALSLGGLVLAIIMQIFSPLFSFGSLTRDILDCLAYLFSAISLLQLGTAKGNGEFRIFSALAIIASGALLVTGERVTAILSLLICQIGMTAVAALASRLDHEVEGAPGSLPETVEWFHDDRSEEVPMRTILPGEQIIVKERMAIPVDGVVRNGNSYLNRVLLTGQKEPQPIGPGDKVSCGEINLRGNLYIEVSALPEKSAIHKVWQLLFSGLGESVVIPKSWSLMLFGGILLLTAFLGFWQLRLLPLFEWVEPLALLLLTAAPCGIYASVRAVRISAMVSALRKGMILSGSPALRSLAEINTVVTGYTGVLTEGGVQVAEVLPAEGYNQEEILRLAASAESESAHPIGMAIRAAYHSNFEEPLPVDRIALCEDIEGRGVRAMVEERITIVGSERMMAESGISVPDNSAGQFLVYVASRGELIGMILLTETQKASTPQMVPALKAAGVGKTVLLTGVDNAVARVAADGMGFDEVLADCNMEAKGKSMLYLVERAKAQKANLLYVGDGSDVQLFSHSCGKVLLGMGAVNSMDSMLGIADAILPSGEPEKVASLLRLCKNTRNLLMGCFLFGAVAKILLLLGVAFLGLPLYAVVLVDVAIPLTIWLTAYFSHRDEKLPRAVEPKPAE